MGDRSPKANQKNANQKKAKHDTADAKKIADADAKKVPQTTKK